MYALCLILCVFVRWVTVVAVTSGTSTFCVFVCFFVFLYSVSVNLFTCVFVRWVNVVAVTSGTSHLVSLSELPERQFGQNSSRILFPYSSVHILDALCLFLCICAMSQRCGSPILFPYFLCTFWTQQLEKRADASVLFCKACFQHWVLVLSAIVDSTFWLKQDHLRMNDSLFDSLFDSPFDSLLIVFDSL